ncbi:hypothetical protein HY384_02395 [Candidatus Daviesbacteria bacterium]|nr:hypothetical protein [Candidatus Daviesbacteria bacterium]
MQIPKPHINIKVRDIFRKIYQNKQINLSASRDSLQEQLNLYLDHFGKHINHLIPQKDKGKIWAIIERNNQVAKILQTPNQRKIIKKQYELIGRIALGLVFCIDGRIPAIFIGGRFARHFEVPAGEISTLNRKSDGKIIPDSSDLNEALRRIASSGDDLLEIIFAHTSLSNPRHGCGAMMAKRKANLKSPGISLEEANLNIIQQKTIPAISNMYQEFRTQLGLEPLKLVAVAALYDTDTFGIILNYDLRKEGKHLSISELTNKYKGEMDEYFQKNNLFFGSMKEKFCDLKYFTHFYQNVMFVEESLMGKKVAAKISEEVKGYIKGFYPDMTDHQKNALFFLLLKNISFQYLTGSSVLKKRVEHHPFFSHEESYMAVAMRGATIGKFDPQNQAFAASPADPKQAIANINIMLPLLGKSQKPYILFVCNSINLRDLKENSVVLQRLLGSNSGLLRDIIADQKLGQMIEKGEMVPVPVLIEENTREVLKIVDHSGYI